jgi:two-component system, sensor histidine kinase and response regulator
MDSRLISSLSSAVTCSMKEALLKQPQRSAKVLIVDDAADNYLLLHAILKSEGYEISFADSGPKALERVQSVPPDLVLLDVMMPGMDGFEVTRRIRDNTDLPFIPILLITAYDQPSVALGLNAGADEFIRKPVEPDELIARVRSLLRLKLSIDERDRIARQREDFVSRLTHDLRTPLVAAERALNLLEQQTLGKIPEVVQKLIATMIRSNQNMLKMVNSLLEVYRYEAGKKPLALMPVNLWELIEDIVQELQPLATAKELVFTAYLPASAVDKAEIITSVTGDYLELRRVLVNIIGNAIKFTAQGSVQVRLCPSVNLKLSGPSQRYAVIEIEDTGPGIAAAEQSVIFESFRHGQHEHSGTGLGLNLSHCIIEAHQGKIEVCSQVGRGSTFTIYLPADSLTTASDASKAFQMQT